MVATSALGMGYDKADLTFVVHFQAPGSVVSYYQQVGRAGRGVDHADVVLLRGGEDRRIQDFFIEQAFPAQERVRAVLDELETAGDGGPHHARADERGEPRHGPHRGDAEDPRRRGRGAPRRHALAGRARQRLALRRRALRSRSPRCAAPSRRRWPRTAPTAAA